VIAVHNEGRAIPPDRLATLFEPFRRGAAAVPGELRGSVGLALLRQISQRLAWSRRDYQSEHGGKLDSAEATWR